MQYRQISLTDLNRDPDQPRKDYQADDLTKEQEKGLDELAGSLKAHGVIEPLVVEKADDGYRIISGERRYLAAHRAGLNKVPCLVRSPGEGEQEVQEAEKLALQLSENVMREDMSDYDVAAALANLRDGGMSRDVIAELMGQNPAWVSTRMTYFKEANEAEKAGIKSAEVWAKFRRLPKHKRAELIAEYERTGEAPTTGRIAKARTEATQERSQEAGYSGPKGPKGDTGGSMGPAQGSGESPLPTGSEEEDEWAAEAAKLLEEEPAVQVEPEKPGSRGPQPGKGYDPVRMGEPNDPEKAFSQFGAGESNPFAGLGSEPPVDVRLTERQWQDLLAKLGQEISGPLDSDSLQKALLEALGEKS